jgi:hypothetical protein
MKNSKDAHKAILAAIRKAEKQLPFRSSKQQNELLEFAADDKADAYRIGAEESQGQIVRRLTVLLASYVEESQPVEVPNGMAQL